MRDFSNYQNQISSNQRSARCLVSCLGLGSWVLGTRSWLSVLAGPSVVLHPGCLGLVIGPGPRALSLGLASSLVLGPCPRALSSGLVLGPCPRALSSGLVLGPCPRALSSGLVLGPCLRALSLALLVLGPCPRALSLGGWGLPTMAPS